MKLPRIRIEWYKPGGLNKVDEYTEEYIKELEFTDGSDLVIIKASVLRKAIYKASRKTTEYTDRVTTDYEQKFEFKADHFIVVNRDWEGYEVVDKSWKQAAEDMGWSDEE